MKGVYVVGEPGAGKSTWVAGWLGPGVADHLGLAVTWHRNGRVLQLGAQHSLFPGTDRLSMSVLPRALDLVTSCPAPVVVAEGDRLATRKFLDPFAEACERFILVEIASIDAAARRAARGSAQSDAWVKGRVTKVRRLVEGWPGEVMRLIDPDGAVPPPLDTWG